MAASYRFLLHVGSQRGGGKSAVFSAVYGVAGCGEDARMRELMRAKKEKRMDGPRSKRRLPPWLSRWLKRQNRLSQTQFIAYGFFGIIMAGTLALMLPFANRSGQNLGFVNCLFTATSATCVTGLVAADTWSQWTVFGQLVILAMIQIGGLGVYYHRRVSLHCAEEEDRP